ncbi:MAG: helix-turn-helix transcriptional regulator [Heliobacteriaceae bacterium]|jgi:transcriptional regulator with XRE-family HTH domain|nr:helix-turn-helix transcriptional regulator [Heliobacteriaceae bacterium]
MNIKESIGLRIKEFRKKRSITQEQLAEMVNLDVGYISKLEVGRNFPTIGTLNKIAMAFNVDISEFFKHTSVNNIDIKSELNKIFDSLSYDKQILLYKIACEMA